jgi:hypothetical protein
MNERMYQFCRQAQAYTESHHQPGTYSADEWVRTFSQKFAELIVAECAGIYSKIDNGNLHMGTDNYLEALYKTFRS